MFRAIVDILKFNVSTSPDISDNVKEVVKSFKQEQEEKAISLFDIKIKDLDAGKSLLALSREEQVELVLYTFTEFNRYSSKTRFGGSYSNCSNISFVHVMQSIFSRFMKRDLPFKASQLFYLLKVANNHWDDYSWYYPHKVIFNAIRKTYPEVIPVDIHKEINRTRKIAKNISGYEKRYIEDIVERAKYLLGERENMTLHGDYNWSKTIIRDTHKLSVKEQALWLNLFGHAFTSGSSKPSNKWVTEAKVNIKKIGRHQFSKYLKKWIELVCKEKYDQQPLVNQNNSNVLKGLIWYCVHLNANEIAPTLRNLAIYSFRKIPNIGAVSAKVGNSCVYVLGQLPGLESVGMLNELLQKVKYPSARKLIEKALNVSAAKNGMSREDLDDLSIPGYNFNLDGVVCEKLGKFTAYINIGADFKTALTWEKPDGKYQKSIPATIKDEYSQEIKELKNVVKESRNTLVAQSSRIEKLFLNSREWPFSDWQKRYIEHPLLQHITHKLIWTFSTDDSSQAGIYRNGEVWDHNNKPIPNTDKTKVSLWHPINAKPEIVGKWREYLYRSEITQPFKQAHREIYILTDAERLTEQYSNRFAAHILKQHQLSALCQQREWEYSLQGGFDSWNAPTIKLPHWDLRVEFTVEPVEGSLTESYIFQYVATDQVRFYRGAQTIPLSDINPLIFSEVMRHVDLFVGVCSIGNDPNWRDGGLEGHYGYWESFSFGELTATAHTRREVLKRIVPKLKIATDCSFDDRFLVVKGKIRTYKIHLGSGNIMMEPNDQYLCIVEGSNRNDNSTSGLILPFEGDHRMAVILSKAFMLADDKNIKDKTIVSQIKGNILY